MKKIVWMGGLILTLIVVGYLALPFYSIGQLQRAAEMAKSEDPQIRGESIDTLEHYVDFPVLRDNLKVRLQAQLRTSIGNSIPQEFDELLGAGANFFMEPLLQQFITPEGIADLLRGGEDLDEFEREIYRQDSAGSAPEPEPSTGKPKEDAWRRMSWRFTDVNHLSVDYGEQDRAELRLLMQRNGLRWQLVDIELLNEIGRGTNNGDG
ncbi:DUF2939 domain-containing protein [Microbulbifer sp. OS29]|uniref:DUF2939 domain-containing protein n=1 Tax=Microbulbifer okhotskensis TaxID=2926617 RepID=A0A9X2EJC6_9GAMM|nr:DUF2939 domain-containing protein [Microbulbifer okhotskensis]MCO1332756.1 DUF2939 domain-containing protein [Microbulbifer okhotskensis]